jgi:hypothetical protein
MTNEFKIEVPIEMKEKSSRSSGGGDGLGFKKLTGAVLAGNIATKVLTSMLDGLKKIMEPLTKILSLLFFIIFIPLMPLVKLIVETLAKFIKGLNESRKNAEEMIPKSAEETTIGKLYNAIIRPFIVFGAMIGDWLYNAIIEPAIDFGMKIGDWLYNTIIAPTSEAITNVILWIVNLFKSVFTSVGYFLLRIGTMIWDKILAGLDFIKDLGLKLWNWIRNALSTIGDLGRKISDWIMKILRSLNPFSKKRASGGPVASGETYLVGEKGPELFSPTTSGTIVPNHNLGGGSLTINITGNSFNNENDMRKMVDLISKKLQQQIKRSYN